MTEATATNSEQLNLKVKSQVSTPLLRMVRRSSSRSRAPLNSKNWWTPTPNARAYFISESAQRQQRPFPLRWWTTPREPDPQGPPHGERRRNRCRHRTSWRQHSVIISCPTTSNSSFYSTIHCYSRSSLFLRSLFSHVDLPIRARVLLNFTAWLPCLRNRLKNVACIVLMVLSRKVVDLEWVSVLP